MKLVQSSRLPVLMTALAVLVGTAALGAAVSPVARPRPAREKLAYQANAPSLHPNLARGLDLGSRFDSDGYTSVNLFNGNLLAALSLGPSYPVDSRLSYGLTLHYNSHVWDFQQLSGEGRPSPFANAGLGFDLSLGRLAAPGSAVNPTPQWLYVAPDGSPHLFYSDLHHDTPDVGDSGDAVRYTRDGTYLRLRLVSASDARVESPGGTWQVFEAIAGEWRLRRMASPSGLGVDLAYAADGSSWTLTDSHGRIQTVFLAADPLNPAARVIDRVEMSAFGGARAVWDFTYGVAAVPRDCADPRAGAENATLLTSLTDPLGAVQTFDYDITTCAGGGRLRRMKLPTGGFLEWTYASWSFPAFDCVTKTPAYFRTVSAVTSRKKVLPNNTIAGAWTYAEETDAAAGAACGFDGRRTVVTTPLGDKTVYHFAVGTASATAGVAALYGLPIAPTQADPSGQLHLSRQIYDCAPGGEACTLVRTEWSRWEQDQACASITGLCFDTNRRLARSRVVYLDDPPPAGGERFSETANSGYDGLGNYRVTVQSSNFGRSDYLRTRRWTNPEANSYLSGGLGEGGSPANFQVPGLAAPWVLFDYSFVEVEDEVGSPVRGDACFSADGWLLRSRSRAVAVAPSSQDVVTANSWVAGEIAETARLGGDLQALDATVDLCTLALPPAAAARRIEHAYGSLARETDLGASGLPLSFRRIDRDIDRDTGLVAAERDVSGLGTTFQYDLLGRQVWEQPAEGAWVQTVHEVPNGSSDWNSGPKATRYRRPNGGGAPLETSFVFHDVFGRRTGEWSSRPGGTLGGRRWQFDAQGFVTSESNAYLPGAPSTLSWTQNLDLDPFGRPRIVRPAEGAAHEEAVVYLGARESRRTYKSGKAYAGATNTCYEDNASSIRQLDGQGREWFRRVSQPQPLPGRIEEIERSYSPTGQLRTEVTRRTVGTAARASSTEHEIDGRGFTLSTTLREENRVVSTSTYAEFDARGLHHRESQAGDLNPAPGISTLRSYDEAGRLVSIVDAGSPSKLWKELVYGEENLGSDRRLGRVQREVRHNYFEGAHHTVTETYTYAGLGGRLSEKTVAIATVSSPNQELRMDKTYRLTQAYDDLGAPTSVGFPTCLLCSAGEPQTSFVLNPTYSQGRLTALAGTRGGTPESWLAGVTWSLSGRQREVMHANGIQDVFEPDLFNRPRPSAVRVQTSGGVVRYDSGPIVYDGAGIRCGVGSRSVVNEPYAGPTDDGFPTGPCAMPYRIDPFGQWNGEIPVAECRGISQPSMKLFDASDRVVAILNRAAVKPTNYQNYTFWVPDPLNFVRTWRLIGFDGRLLTEVEDRSNQAWKARTDFIYALGEVQGKAIQTSTAPGFVQQVHKHPMGVRNTGANGNPLATEM